MDKKKRYIAFHVASRLNKQIRTDIISSPNVNAKQQRIDKQNEEHAV
ncbi:13881_t:CDS:2 [Cetraspora pellucida]|uniref:13881_t:CDS:1 n=1 Tax=Cetraspora pellucida TaxID=1433469 RepID=A0A9N9FYP9_9GLOM|nr:13881_t:CDS:2 [Cetraspora pellucida]